MNEPNSTSEFRAETGPFRYPRALWYILIVGAIVRLAIWGVFAGSPEHIVDAQDYDRLAIALVETGSYLTESGDFSSLRPPLYPWCVAVGYHLFGTQNHEPIRLAQAALSLLTVLIVFHLARLLFNDRVALFTAGLHCFYPYALGFNNLLLSETLFTFFVTLSVYMVAEAMTRMSAACKTDGRSGSAAAWLIGAGIVLGLGTLTRSILWLYTPVLGLLLLLFGAGTFSKRATGSFLMMLAFAMTIAPWAYRNTKVQKTFTIVDVMGGRNVMMGNYEYTPLERSWATIDIATGDRSWISVLIKEQGSLKGLTQGQIDKLAMSSGIRFMLSHPGLTMKRTLVRFFNFWQLDRTLVAGLREGYWIQASTPVIAILAALIMGYYAILALTGIWGIIFAEPRDWRVHGLVLFTIMFPCFVHAAIFAHSRYHVPVMPLVTIYSAFAITSFQRFGVTRSGYWRWVACGACVVLVLAWVREIVVVDLIKMSSSL